MCGSHTVHLAASGWPDGLIPQLWSWLPIILSQQSHRRRYRRTVAPGLSNTQARSRRLRGLNFVDWLVSCEHFRPVRRITYGRHQGGHPALVRGTKSQRFPCRCQFVPLNISGPSRQDVVRADAAPISNHARKGRLSVRRSLRRTLWRAEPRVSVGPSSTALSCRQASASSRPPGRPEEMQKVLPSPVL